MLPSNQAAIREFVDSSGRRPFADWFNALEGQAAAKVAVAITRLSVGNFSNVKGVGSGVFEYKIDFGPATESTLARMASV
jgi:putative addiction module killer protein